MKYRVNLTQSSTLAQVQQEITSKSASTSLTRFQVLKMLTMALAEQVGNLRQGIKFNLQVWNGNSFIIVWLVRYIGYKPHGKVAGVIGRGKVM